MSKAKSSGISLNARDASVVLGMVARNDRDHDIAAWFGVNQGRIADVKDGKYGTPPISQNLPPKGPPGVKGRRLRKEAEAVLKLLDPASKPAQMLASALAEYDKNEA